MKNKIHIISRKVYFTYDNGVIEIDTDQQSGLFSRKEWKEDLTERYKDLKIKHNACY